MIKYIGVTGFRKPEEIRTVQQFAPVISNRRIHYGVMTGRKKLQGEPTKYHHSFLSLPELINIFPDPKEQDMFCIHYADYGEHNLPESTLTSLLTTILENCPKTHAIQLDMVLPPPEAINPIIQKFPHIEWILQINPETLGQRTIPQIHEYLKKFHRVDWLLYDQSKGQGVLGEWEKMQDFMEQFSQYQVALAGGLGPETLDSLGPLNGGYSIDAQGRLTRPGEDRFNPYLDLSKVQEYLIAAEKAVR